MSDNDDAFSGAFSDWDVGVKPGTRLSLLIGRLRYRQGNDIKDWSGAGGTKYVVNDWHMQVGAHEEMFTQRSSGGFEVTFPIPFAEPPLFVVSPAGTKPLFEEIRFQATVQSAAVFEVYWWSTNNLTRVYVNWLAIGPIAL